jgi:MFS family permease
MAARAWRAGSRRLLSSACDGTAFSLVAVIFLTEAAIAVIFFSLVQQYPAHLLRHQGLVPGPGHGLLRAAAAYTGYALSAYGLAKFVGQPLFGWLIDRFGARRLLLIGIAAKLCVIVTMAALSSLLVFVLLCAAYGLTSAVVWPAVYALIGDFYGPSRRGRITAAISGAQVSGSAGGFAVGALLIDHTGFFSAFALAFGVNLLALVLAVGPEPKREAAASAVPAGTEHPLGFRCTIAALRQALSVNLVILTAIMVTVSLAVSILAPDLRPYSAAVLHLRFSVFALLLAIPAVVAMLTLIPSGIIADALGRGAPMVLAAALWTVSVLALALVRAVPLAVLFATVAAFAYALGLPAWSASLIDLSMAGRRGLQVGLASAVQAIGLAVGPAAGGLMIENLGALAPFRFSAALMLVVLALSVAYRARVAGTYVLPQTETASSS